jgi:hypothetical protein
MIWSYRIRLWYSVLWRRVVLWVDRNVLEQHAVANFKIDLEDGDGMLLQNVAIYPQDCTAPQVRRPCSEKSEKFRCLCLLCPECIKRRLSPSAYMFISETDKLIPIFRKSALRMLFRILLTQMWQIGYGLDDQGIAVWFLAGPWDFSLVHSIQPGSGAHETFY